MWPRRCLRMILHAKHRMRLVTQSLHRSVVQIHMRHLDIRGQRRRIDGEPVVLRRDLDLAGCELLHRMIRAAVAELQLERGASHREAENLVTETDPEYRQVGRDEGL